MSYFRRNLRDVRPGGITWGRLCAMAARRTTMVSVRLDGDLLQHLHQLAEETREGRDVENERDTGLPGQLRRALRLYVQVRAGTVRVVPQERRAA